jgi:uncharacterized repeat protein (TIGR03833 family)
LYEIYNTKDWQGDTNRSYENERKKKKSMNGTKRNDIKIGTKVQVVQKQDQRSGKLTEGTVQKILTNAEVHPHGIKVMLDNGIVGRVKVIE